MFTLWYAHLIYQEYRHLLERLYARRPLAIEAPNISQAYEILPDISDSDDDMVRYAQSTSSEQTRYIPVPIAIDIPDWELGASFQPLATSSPLLRSFSTSPTSEDEHIGEVAQNSSSHDAPGFAPIVFPEVVPEVVPEVTVPAKTVPAKNEVQEKEADPNRTPSFSNVTSSSDPMLMINKQKQDYPQSAQGAKQEESQKFLESERKKGIEFSGETSSIMVIDVTKNSFKDNEDGDDADEEEAVDEEDSEMEEEEEENSVISSTPSNIRSSATPGTGSSIEVINHEITEED